MGSDTSVWKQWYENRKWAYHSIRAVSVNVCKLTVHNYIFMKSIHTPLYIKSLGREVLLNFFRTTCERWVEEEKVKRTNAVPVQIRYVPGLRKICPLSHDNFWHHTVDGRVVRWSVEESVNQGCSYKERDVIAKHRAVDLLEQGMRASIIQNVRYMSDDCDRGSKTGHTSATIVKYAP